MQPTGLLLGILRSMIHKQDLHWCTVLASSLTHYYYLIMILHLLSTVSSHASRVVSLYFVIAHPLVSFPLPRPWNRPAIIHPPPQHMFKLPTRPITLIGNIIVDTHQRRIGLGIHLGKPVRELSGRRNGGEYGRCSAYCIHISAQEGKAPFTQIDASSSFSWLLGGDDFRQGEIGFSPFARQGQDWSCILPSLVGGFSRLISDFLVGEKSAQPPFARSGDQSVNEAITAMCPLEGHALEYLVGGEGGGRVGVEVVRKAEWGKEAY
jgi:hypothetical protein